MSKREYKDTVFVDLFFHCEQARYGRKKYGHNPLLLKDSIFLNLYNGKEDVKDIYDSYLSDLISRKILENTALELKVTNININVGHNEKLFRACPILKDYSLFVAEVRKQLQVDKEKGFDIAVDSCIQKGILENYLKENRSGVMGLFFGEYNMETALEVAREESYDKGKTEGRAEGIEKGIERGIEKGIERGSYDTKIETAKRGLSIGLPISTIMELTGLTNSEIVLLK